MDGLRIIPVTNEELIFSVSALADEIWHEHFSSILSTEQIDYMLEKFLSPELWQTRSIMIMNIFYFHTSTHLLDLPAFTKKMAACF